jgi:protein-L-isoaspartate(D-aspartate) O-methyltransferase
MIDFAVARKKMVENQLRTSSINDRRLLSVMAQVPRELFVPEDRRDLAYIDEAHRLPSSSGNPRYLAAPAPFGRLVQLAGIDTDDKILDVGCGTGYSTVVLASLAETVIGVESELVLAAAARQHLMALGFDNARVLDGPLAGGAPADGPFDVIIIEGAVEAVGEPLFAQLAEGGRLVAIIKRDAAAVAHLFVKSGRDVASRAEFNTTLPVLPAAKGPAEFVF